MSSMAGSFVGADSEPDPPLLCILGPTASGKTGLSLDLAEAFDGEIVIMDSAQIYAGLPIGTAKPNPEELARAPHHLLGLFAWNDVCSAARWAAHARACILEIAGRGKLPILCGGTFLYLRALVDGLHDLPASAPALRAGLEKRAAKQGSPALHATLQERDPETARRLHPNDTQRIVRALEILELTGVGREAHFARGAFPNPADAMVRPWQGNIAKLALMPGNRDQLRERIAIRFGQMLEEGLWDEVRAAYQSPEFDAGLPIMKAVGYRQLFAALDGRMSESEAVERAIIATRQYAKRQLTWLRKDLEVAWLDSSQPDLRDEAIRATRQKLALLN